jgi:HTH-type transcriptional regulator/antitoxin HigA
MKTWTVIQNESDYTDVLNRIEELSIDPPAPDTDKGRELMLLGYLADKYEEETFPINYPDPVEAIKVRMEELGLSVGDLLDVFGDRGIASKVLSRKRSISINMISALSKKLTLPEALLMQHAPGTRKKSPFLVREPKSRYSRKSKRDKK